MIICIIIGLHIEIGGPVERLFQLRFSDRCGYLYRRVVGHDIFDAALLRHS